MKRPAKVPSLVYIKHPKVGVVEKKRHKDQRNLTKGMLVVCIIGNMNNEQYGITAQLGVYVSLIIKYSQYISLHFDDPNDLLATPFTN